MKSDVIFVANSDELQKYNDDIAEHGTFEEVFNLGLHDHPVKPKFTTSKMLFHIDDVSVAWIYDSPDGMLINIKMMNNDVWSLPYKEETWNKLTEFFE